MPDVDRHAVVTFDSTHHAMAAEDLLRERGVRLEVIPPPADLTAGCGLALRIASAEAEAVIRLLTDRGATFAGIYLLDDDQRASIRLG